MPRQPRVYIEEVLYYVTSRSGHTYTLFTDEADYKEYLSLVAKYKEQYKFKLFAYVLLPKHLHMLIELKNNVAISNIMHDINSIYTKTYNTRYSKKGHLFQERFKTVLAEKEAYLLPLTRHIHLNPKRENMVYDPKDYQHSSHNAYLDPERRGFPDMKSEIEEVFGLIKDGDKGYESYVVDCDQHELDGIKKSLHKKWTLGSAAFKERLEKVMEESLKKQEEALPDKKRPIVYLVFGAASLVLLAMSTTYFYRQNTQLKTEYNNTLELYKRTLDSLHAEQNLAVKENKEAQNYDWKIKLTEQAIEDLKRKDEEASRQKKELDGYAWNVEFTQVSGPAKELGSTDVIIFGGRKVDSHNLKLAGFSSTNYSKSVSKDGAVIWETMQLNDKKEMANWRGQWDGKTMKGVLRFSSADGAVRDYQFTSSGERSMTR